MKNAGCVRPRRSPTSGRLGTGLNVGLFPRPATRLPPRDFRFGSNTAMRLALVERPLSLPLAANATFPSRPDSAIGDPSANVSGGSIAEIQIETLPRPFAACPGGRRGLRLAARRRNCRGKGRGRIRRRSSVAASKTALTGVQKSQRERHLSLGRGRGRSTRCRRSNRPGNSQVKGPQPRFEIWREALRASAEGIAFSGKRTEGRQQRGSIDPVERCAHVRYRCRL